MSQPKINPATGYVHDDSQLEEKPFPEPVGFDAVTDAHIEEIFERQPETVGEVVEGIPDEDPEVKEASE